MQSLTTYIQHPELLNAEAVRNLEQLVERHPSFQTARLLYLLGLFQLQDDRFGAELRKAAVCLPDRRQLFYLFDSDHYQWSAAKQPAPKEAGTNSLTPAPFAAASSQADLSQAASSQASPSQAASSQASPSQAGSSQAETSQAGSSQAETSQAGSPQVGTSQAGSSQTSPSQAASANPTVPISGDKSAVLANGADTDRTQTLIDSFLSQLPEQPKSKSRSADATVDYMSYLMQLEDVPTIQNSDKEEDIESLADDLEEEIGKEAHLVHKTDPSDTYFTETLARIYIKQGKYTKAIEIIRRISLIYPKKNRYFADQIRFLEKLIINERASNEEITNKNI